MFKTAASALALGGLVCFAGPALAQDALSVTVADSEEYGQYLADSEGRALYLFTTDTQGQGEDEAEVSCTGECLDAWPPAYTEGEPEAGEGADASLLGTIDHDGRQMATYNGWPLYYFVRDEGADEPQGQEVESFGGEWYLVTPEGEELEGE